MTAEVAVLNKSAVALAADSKVTIGSGGSEKTYDSVNKIFTLSKRHPVGCMIYGNADFMQYPWETIIKLYRKDRADRSEDTVEAYGRSFIRFLKKFEKFTQPDIQLNVTNLLRSVFSQLEKRVLYEAELEGATSPSAEYEKIYLTRVERTTDTVRAGGAWLNRTAARSVLTKYSKVIGQVVAESIPNGKNSKLVDASIHLAAAALLHNYFSPQMSGLVIAGFGEREFFPSVVSFETDGYIGSQVKVSKADATKISTKNQSSVLAFAQHDIAYRFMEGIDPGYAGFIQGLIRASLTETNLKVFEKWAPKNKQTAKTKAEISKLASDAFENIIEMSKRYRLMEFSGPTTDMISILPKDELAHVAESLLALTSLHRRISRDLETVGGPIDVAVISKGDGFIWLKRKHYFRRELNPQFNQNYMRDAGG